MDNNEHESLLDSFTTEGRIDTVKVEYPSFYPIVRLYNTIENYVFYVDIPYFNLADPTDIRESKERTEYARDNTLSMAKTLAVGLDKTLESMSLAQLAYMQNIVYKNGMQL